MANRTDKKTLIAELAVARGELGACTAALRLDLDLGARLKRAFRAHPATWIGGAAVLGLLLTRAIPRREKVVIERPAFRSKETAAAGTAAFALTALKFGLDFAKPVLLRWFRDRYLGRSRDARDPY